MANSITGNGSATIIVGGSRYTADFTTNTVPVGSGSYGASYNINTGSWQAIQVTGSISVMDVSKIFIDNPAGPGIVQYSTASSGVPVIATLNPTDWTWLSWTGSQNILYAKAVDTASANSIVVVTK